MERTSVHGRRSMSDNQGEPSSYKAVAAVPSADAARSATEALRQAGFAEERVSASNESVAELPESERRARDAKIGRKTRAATWTWALIGAIVGAVLGALGTLLFTDAGITGIATVGVAGAILFGIVAALVAGYGSLDDARPSEAPVVAGGQSRSIVGVSVGTREELDRATTALRSSGASAIEVFDQAGNPVDAI
ncbi:MAG: hypothetical protein ACJ758_06220 [Actinomycetota bacterium]